MDFQFSQPSFQLRHNAPWAIVVAPSSGVYDVLLALLTTVISAVWLHISLLKNIKKVKTAEKEKITADC